MRSDPMRERGLICLELTYPRRSILWFDHILLECPCSYPLCPVFDLSWLCSSKLPAPLGFNVGDIAMVINIIAKVAQALKDTGETSSRYRMVLQTLLCLLLTIQYLRQVQTKCTDPYLINAILTLTATSDGTRLAWIGGSLQIHASWWVEER